jgi:hypothetical protein
MANKSDYDANIPAVAEAARVMLATLRDARLCMQMVVDAWESGDLAGAVNCLPIDDAEEAIRQAEAAGIKDDAI